VSNDIADNGIASVDKKELPKWASGEDASPVEYKKAEQVFASALASMIIAGDKALYAYLLMRFKRIFSTKNVPTMGVGMSATSLILCINPHYVLSLNQNQIQTVLEHEFLHIIMMHPIRTPIVLEHTLWNIACDIVVNEFMESNFLEKENITYDGFLEQYHDFPSRFSSANVYYQFLRQKIEQDGELKMPGGGKAEVKMIDDHSMWGTPDEEDMADYKDISKKYYEGIIKGELQEAYIKTQGKLPGQIKSLIRRILNSEVPWNVVLRRFVTSTRNNTRRYTLKRYNRRLQLPPGYCRERKLNLCAIIDTSGSINNKQLSAFLNELNTISRYKSTELTIIESDARVGAVYKFKRKEVHEFTGRGGTDFRPAFDYIAEKRLSFDGVVYFTDGCGTAPQDKPKFPVLWVYTKDHDRAAPWGSSVIMQGT